MEPAPSGGGPCVYPSETHCTHVCGLQVAVMVGLEGDPLGRNVLGLPASVSAIVVVAEVVRTVEVMAVAPSAVTVGIFIRKFQCHHLILSINGGKEVPS